MKLESIGKYIREYRIKNHMRQEDLAEKAELSVNYIGMLERGEKLPSLETFITIVNVLGVSADVILADLLDKGYEVKASLLNEKLANVSPDTRATVYDVIDAIIKNSK